MKSLLRLTNFEKLNEKELLQAYRGYLKMAKTGAVGEDDFDGLFRRAIDEQSKEHPGRGVINATQDLLAAIANRWFEEHSQYSGKIWRFYDCQCQG